MQGQKQFCLTLDLRDDEALIQEYEQYHKPGNTWPEIIASIRDSGILDMQIYRTGTQLIMVMTVDNSFSFEDKALRDSQYPIVKEWERLMTKFQCADADASGIRNGSLISGDSLLNCISGNSHPNWGRIRMALT
jgi:L-rhamnose mutarotase